MSSKKLSRGPDIDREKCVAKIGVGMYDMILAGAARARELAKQQRDKPVIHYQSPVVTALLEVQEGQIGLEYLAKVDTKSQRISY